MAGIAFWTASIASVRIVLIASCSRFVSLIAVILSLPFHHRVVPTSGRGNAARLWQDPMYLDRTRLPASLPSTPNRRSAMPLPRSPPRANSVGSPPMASLQHSLVGIHSAAAVWLMTTIPPARRHVSFLVHPITTESDRHIGTHPETDVVGLRLVFAGTSSGARGKRTTISVQVDRQDSPLGCRRDSSPAPGIDLELQRRECFHRGPASHALLFL